MNTTKRQLDALHGLLDNFANESGDVVLGRMIPEFAEPLVSLSHELDKSQRRVIHLTWAILGLTVFLAFVSGAQLWQIGKA